MDANAIISALKYDEKFRMDFLEDPVSTINKVYPLTDEQKAELKKINPKALLATKTVTDDCSSKFCSYMAG